MQREFLETLESDTSRRPQDRRRKKPPVANEFALGYTYQDVLDADHDGEPFSHKRCALGVDRLETFLPAFPSTFSPNHRLNSQLWSNHFSRRKQYRKRW